jgi:hypothetical protein
LAGVFAALDAASDEEDLYSKVKSFEITEMENREV